MLNRQFSLLVMVALLISPNLAQANQVDGNTDLSVGKVRIQTTPNGTKVQTPGVQIDSPKSTESRVAVSRTRRRSRVAPVRRSRTSTPLILNKKVSTDSKTTVTTTTSPGAGSIIRTTTTTSSPEDANVRTTTTRNSGTVTTINSSPNSTVRRTTIRNSNIDNDSETVTEQQQSSSCSGGSGTVVQSSSSTVNGRTVSSQSRSNCN
jgi:hypothetical protein